MRENDVCQKKCRADLTGQQPHTIPADRCESVVQAVSRTHSGSAPTMLEDFVCQKKCLAVLTGQQSHTTPADRCSNVNQAVSKWPCIGCLSLLSSEVSESNTAASAF